MFRLLVLSCLLVLAFGIVPHGKIADIFKDFDFNENDNINANEVLAFFENLKLKPDDSIITEATFVKKWMAKYHDTEAMCKLMYHHMDVNQDNLLTDADVPLFYAEMDKNRNGIEWNEFEKFFNEWYSASQ